MSEHIKFKPELVTTPSLEELSQLVQRIKVEENWKTRKGRAITTEYLQAFGERLVDNTPMTGEEWDKINRYIYGTINISDQPEAKKMWELFLERGINDLSRLIQQTSIENIRDEAKEWLADKKYPEGEFQNETQKLMEYWINGEKYMLWFHEITRMLDYAAGTSEETVIRLAKKMIDEVCIPYGKKIKEIDPNNPKPGMSEIIELVRRIEYAREILGEAASGNREERIRKVADEIHQHNFR